MAAINKEKCRNKVLDALNGLGSMTIEQATAINDNNPIAFGIIKEMVRNGEAFYIKDKTAIAKNPRINYNADLYEAFNIVMPFMSTIRPSSLYLPYMEVDENGNPKPKKDREHKRRPGDAKICFSRGKKVYRVAVIKHAKDLPFIVKRYEAEYNELKDTADIETRFLMGIYKEEIIEHMPHNVNFPYAFAIITPQEEGLPEIDFISGESLDIPNEIQNSTEED